MSNQAFPVFQMGQWDYSWPIKRTPRYKTILQEPANMIGCVHISLTPFTTWEYDINLSFLKGYGNYAGGNSPYQTVIGFYGQMRGSFDTWLFLDPFDNGIDSDGNAITYDVGVGDGSNTLFQTLRSMNGLVDLIQNISVAVQITAVQAVGSKGVYSFIGGGLAVGQVITITGCTSGGNNRTSEILAVGLNTFTISNSAAVTEREPSGASASVGGLNVYVNDVVQTINTAYTYDQYGTITFQSGYIPAADAVVSWNAPNGFWFRCHFAEDALTSLQNDLFSIWSVKSLKFTTELL